MMKHHYFVILIIHLEYSIFNRIFSLDGAYHSLLIEITFAYSILQDQSSLINEGVNLDDSWHNENSESKARVNSLKSSDAGLMGCHQRVQEVELPSLSNRFLQRLMEKAVNIL